MEFPIAFEKVGKAWILKYGCLPTVMQTQRSTGKSDTTMKFIVGRDTVQPKLPCEYYMGQKIDGVAVYVNDNGVLKLNTDYMLNVVLRVDTVKITVIDGSLVQVLQDSLTYYRRLAKK